MISESLDRPDPGPSQAAGAWVPRMLAHLVSPAGVRTEFPLLLLPPGQEGPASRPLSEALAQAASGLTGEGARLVADNLIRIEGAVTAAVNGASAPIQARTLLDQVCHDMAQGLALKAGPDAALRAGLDALVQQIDGDMLPYSPDADLWLVLHAARWSLLSRQVAMAREIRRLRDRLGDLVALEEGRQRSPEAVSASLAATGALFDATQLARLVGQQKGGVPVSADKLERARTVLAVLREAVAATPTQVVLVHSGAISDAFARQSGIRVVRAEDPYRAATGEFETLAAAARDLYGAVRTARLLLAGAYEPEQHDGLLARFDWQEFTADELASLGRVFVVDATACLGGNRLGSLLDLLRSGRPVQVLIEARPAVAGPDANPLAGTRLDLASLSLALGSITVLQTTPARPEHMIDGLRMALSRPEPGLCVTTSGYLPNRSTSPVGAWLTASAAIESRAHPLFRVDPEAGPSWAHRMDASGNPQPDQPWAREDADDGAADGAEGACFTFADFALLDPALASSFRQTTEAEVERTMPVSAWIEGLPATVDRLPVIHAARAEAPEQGCTLVVSPELALAAAERLRAWRSLAELAGIGNEHARRAAEEARRRATDEARREREALERSHADALQALKATATDEAMSRLTDVLLGTDVLTASPAPRAPAPAAPAGPAATEAAQPSDAPAAEASPAQEPEEDAGFDDPWIDTPLCTSCNDCTKLNQLLFVYDGNKQAMLGDMAAYSFNDLVRAAEKCPARCIHPGKPKDAGEANLAELVERAAPFN